jgi:hypothetical protein
VQRPCKPNAFSPGGRTALTKIRTESDLYFVIV